MSLVFLLSKVCYKFYGSLTAIIAACASYLLTSSVEKNVNKHGRCGRSDDCFCRILNRIRLLSSQIADVTSTNLF